MLTVSALAEALVQVARKRRILGSEGCARLRRLLAADAVHTLAEMRRFLDVSSLLPASTVHALRPLLARESDPVFGPYQPLAHLADGGMGTVWLATAAGFTGTGTDLVVVKTLKTDRAGDEIYRKRFLRECRLTAAITHPHVIAIRDLGSTDQGMPFMVLDYARSGDLRQLVEQGGPLSEVLSLALLHQLADALDTAHQHRLIHRDIKPSNIFADADGFCQLADFGLARSTATERTMLTQAGVLTGSPAYMSPEQILAAETIDIRSDLYALGCVLFFCLTGRPPYTGRNQQDVLHQHCVAPVPDPRPLVDALTARTAGLCMRLLAKDRDERYPDPALLRLAVAESLAAYGRVDHGATLFTRRSSSEIAIFPAPPLPSGHEVLSRTSTEKHNPPLRLSLKTATARDPDSTLATLSSDPPPDAGIEAAWAAALDQPWIALLGQGCVLMLYAKPKITLGKLCEPPIDICLRKHPVAQFHADCLRISRQHLRLGIDAGTGRALITDLGGANGTQIDGNALLAHTPFPLDTGREHRCVIAGALTLHLRARATSGANARPDIDNIVITRPDNRPGLSYALVQHALTVGDQDTDLPMHGATGGNCELVVVRGRWLWRAVGQPVWQPVTANGIIPVGGRPLRARLGGFDLFHGEG